MLLKSKDDIAPQVSNLEELLRLRLSPTQRNAIEREIALLKAGFRAERDAAFQIDFRLKDHKRWMIIHDLRLEHNGRVAQIDHLIFLPEFEFYVVETKGIHTKIKIENGQWAFLQKNHWCGMANPVEQNARHIQVLKEVLHDFKWVPRTMGVPVVPRFINVVAVPPECLIRQHDDLTWVLHMDEFVTKARWDVGIAGMFLNLIHHHSGEDARELGTKLVALHHPFQIDYRKRFGIDGGAATSTPMQKALSRRCEACDGPLSDAEAFFCRINKGRFAGKMLCRKCQAYAPSAKSVPMQATPSLGSAGLAARCGQCGKGVETRVVRFCRANSTRFGGRVLCRKCQGTPKEVSLGKA